MLEALIVGAAIAGIGAIGTLYANKKNIQANTSRWNSSVELADTAHQREVADLRAAGLNPILSAGGSGAAVPNVQAPTVESPTASVSEQLSRVADSYANAANTKSQIKLNDSQRDLNDTKREELNNTMAARQGDITEQRIKSEALQANEGKVKKAIVNKLLKEGSPTNAYQGAGQAWQHFGDKFLDVMKSNARQGGGSNHRSWNDFKGNLEDVRKEHERELERKKSLPWWQR